MLLSGYHLQGFLYIFHDWPTDEPPKGRLFWKLNTKRRNIIILDRDPTSEWNPHIIPTEFIFIPYQLLLLLLLGKKI
jgi:hypothetical protein